jgi:hypothetical protein
VQPGTEKKVTVDASWVDSTTGYIWFRTRNLQGNYHWLRQNSVGRIYEWQNRQWYRLGAGPGYPWTMTVDESGTHGSIPCSNGARLEVVSRAEALTVAAGQFSTIHIRYSTSCADVGVTDEWFARGVGLVKRAETSFAGPIFWELRSAKISGRQIGGQQALPAVKTLVEMGQPDYWENHMPGFGTRPTEGPEITIRTTIHSFTSNDAVVNFTDYNTWDITVTDPSGNVVWSNPKNRAMAPQGGVNRTYTAAGEVVDHTFRFPFGTAQGTYQVKAKLLHSSRTSPAIPEVTTSFTYGWAF